MPIGYQRTEIIANLGRDIELRYTQSGKAVASVSAAVTEKYGDKESTEWFNLTFWDKLAEIAAKYLVKGSPVWVCGRLKTESWEKDGETKYKTVLHVSELRMLGTRQNDTTSKQVHTDTFPESTEEDVPF